MKARDVNWAKPSKALVHFMAAGLTVCDLWPAGIGAMVTLFFKCQELTAASESMEADRRASSSGTSFLAWFRKARNASDWWWRARDHGKREREVWVRGGGGWGDCSSLITLQWLSFGYQFPWWFVYFLPPWGLRLSEIFLGYIFNVSQLNNAISLLSSLVRRLHLIYAWYARKSSSADWRTTTWQWNLEIVCQYEVSLYFCFLINYWRKKVVLYTEEFG